MKVQRFEELDCWQEARGLTRAICTFTNRSRFSKDFRLSGQITGAAISVMNNISEGFDSRSTKEFIRFLVYAGRSCSEIQNCLYIALDQSYVAEAAFQGTYRHCEKIRKMIDGLIKYLKSCTAR